MMSSGQELFTGPWAGLPVAWTSDDKFDESVYRSDVVRCCRAGVPGIYTGGTSGEFYAMELDEFREVARSTIEECHGFGVPAMIGCSSTFTGGAVRRAAIAAELGADAIQVTLPFWLKVEDDEIVPFFETVAQAGEGLPLSIYETSRCKRTLTIEQHRAIKEAVPGYLMVKANAGTIGATPEGCEALSDLVSVFTGETLWGKLGPRGVRGSCSAMVYWNPRLVMDLWSKVERGDWEGIKPVQGRITALHEFLHSEFGSRGLTDSALDRLGGLATGFLKTSLACRAPYPSAQPGDVSALRDWCRDHFPELLQLGENEV